MSQPASAAELVGTVIDGRYRITGVLGSGGMATVFRAEHVTIKRPVALKLLQPPLGRFEDFAARFEREAYTLGRLKHPNCVEVIDFGRSGRAAYLVMDLVAGKSLASVLDDETRVPWRRALALSADVLEALANAHEKGIVHRDIKPQNVIVSVEPDGVRAKVLDFGIAKLMGENAGPDLTAIGTAIGTPTYIAPEQALGETIDGRADLYSLSVMLFEMVSGRPPFRGEEPIQTVFQHMNAPIPAIADFAPELEVPESLERLLRDGLAKSPRDRIGSAVEYLARIRQISLPATGYGPQVTRSLQPAARSPQPKMRESRPSPPVRGHKPRTWIAIAGLLAVTIGIAAAIGATSGDRPGEPAEPAPGATASAPALVSAKAPVAAPGKAGDGAGHWWGRPPVSGPTHPAAVPADRPEPEPASEASAGPDRSAPAPVASDRPDPVIAAGADSSRPDLSKVDRLVRARRISAAIDALSRLRKLHPQSAVIPYRLGNLYTEKLWWSHAFANYRAAIANDGRYREDPTLIRNALRSLQSKRHPSLGVRFIRDELGAAAIPQLRAAAKNKRSLRLSRRAAQLLTELERSPSRGTN